jgi:hypothetical protein
VGPRSDTVAYAISSALPFSSSPIWSLPSCCFAFAYRYSAAREGGRLHTEHPHSGKGEKCVY